MTMAIRSCALVCARVCIWVVLASCNSVGFHESSKVNFSRYQTATIAPFTLSSANSDADPIPTKSFDRFVDEIRRVSGFKEVRTGNEESDLVIQVDVSTVAVEVDSTNGTDCCDVAGLVVAALLDTNCADATAHVVVKVNVVATDSQNKKVYTLSDVEGTSDDIECASDRELLDGYADALDDALDQVVLFFLKGFDI